MTSSDILNIVVTVGIIQLLCDLISNYFVYNSDGYKRSCSTLERMKWKYDKAQVDSNKNPEKQTNIKKLQRAKDDYGEACSNVARKHTTPAVLTSIMFIILLRILGTEHGGGNKMIAFLPLIPFNFISNKITTRGINIQNVVMMLNNKNYIQLVNDNDGSDGEEDSSSPGGGGGGGVHVKQITTFLFIYILATLSVKFYVNKLFGTSPPSGADNGLMSVMESPKSQRMLKSMGVNPEDYKME